MKSLPPEGEGLRAVKGRVRKAAPHGKAGSPEPPLIRPSVRTGAPSPLWGEGFSVRLLLTFPLRGKVAA